MPHGAVERGDMATKKTEVQAPETRRREVTEDAGPANALVAEREAPPPRGLVAIAQDMATAAELYTAKCRELEEIKEVEKGTMREKEEASRAMKALRVEFDGAHAALTTVRP